VSADGQSVERVAAWHELVAAQRRVSTALARDLQVERGLALGWYEVMAELYAAGGRLRMQELAVRLVVNKSSLSRMVDRMAEDGYVEREPCVDDARGQFAVLTRDGRAVLRRASPIYRRGVRRHFADALTASDVTALHRALGKVPP
jgi:DNA-binding MarR family transcriptional regulator